MPAPKDKKKYALYCKRIGRASKKLWQTKKYREKITNSLKGKKRPPFSKAWKRHISDGSKDKKYSQKYKENMSKIIKKKFNTPEMKLKFSIIQKKLWSDPSHQRKMSKARKGIKKPLFSKQHKRKLSEAAKNRVYSKEARKNISKARKKMWRNPEYIKKMKERDAMMREIVRSAAFKKKVSKAHLKLWQDDSFRQKMMLSFFHGSKHPQWQGGISFEPYTPEFSKHFKELIRLKFKHKCFICNAVAKHVHHINYNKKMTIEKNAVLLCSKHHGQTNVNRDFWFAYFCYTLNIAPEELVK